MRNALKCEWYKLYKSAYKYMFLALVLAGILMSVFVNVLLQDKTMLSDLAESSTGFGIFIKTLSDTQIIILVGSFLMGILICKDFEERIISAEIARGCTRLNLFVAKSLVFIVSIGLITVPYPLASMLTMSALNGFGTTLSVNTFIYMIAMVLSVAFANMALFSISNLIAFLSKKTIPSISFSILVLLIGGNIINTLGRFFPPLDNFIKFTPFGIINTVLSKTATEMDFIVCVVTSVAFSFVITIINYNFFKKSELK